MASTQQKLSSMWTAGKFEPQIHHIRFPRFKHLHQDMRIEFLYPITALVGPNGTNKTSILRALQGSPEGNDLGTYSFGTAMDRIPEGNRDRFIYGRMSTSQHCVVEIVKTRIGRRVSSRLKTEIDPDLFEPSRPLLREPDSMARYPFDRDTAPSDGSATRWKTIEKNVLYLDFRSQLSAFDWAFHHYNINSSGSPTSTQVQNIRKGKIRAWAPPLARAITLKRRSDVRYRKEKITAPIRILRSEELAAVETILERDYESIEIIRHGYFGGHDGWTAVIHAGDLDYSEAFAGSGEFATIMMVVEILNAPDRSLILLDEPEVSLHPGAQTRLMAFLSETAIKGLHQVVLSTHSREIITQLPPEAVKVLTRRTDNGLVDLIAQSSHPRVAFDAIGVAFDKPTVVVEDELAQAVVQYAVKGTRMEKSVVVRCIPGGASSLWSYNIPLWADEGRKNLLMLFDGDQTEECPPPSSAVAPANLAQVLIDSMHGNTPRLPFGKDEAGATNRRAEIQAVILDWRRQYVDFLPFYTPEHFLWPRRNGAHEGEDLPDGASKMKTAWRGWAQSQLGEDVDSASIFTLQRLALNKIDEADDALMVIRSKIAAFLEKVPA